MGWILLVIVIAANGSVATNTVTYTTRDGCFAAGNILIEMAEKTQTKVFYTCTAVGR